MGERPEGSPLRILVVEDYVPDAELLERQLRKDGIAFTARRVEGRMAFIRELEEFSPDLVLSDFKLPSFTGNDVIDIVRERRPDIPVIIVSGTIGEDIAIETLRRGAADYVMKNNIIRLASGVRRALADIEERLRLRKAEEELQKSENKYRTLVENMEEFVFMFDGDHKLLSLNRAGQILIGKKEEEVVNRSPLELFPEEIGRMYTNHLDKVFNSGQALRNDEAPFVLGEKRLALSTVLSPIKDETGKVTAVMGVCRDVTASKAAEEELRRHREHLEELVTQRTDELLRVREELEQDRNLAAIGGLAAAVAHRLRTPLGAIRLGVYNIKEKVKDAALGHHFINIDRKIAESDQVISNLLFYASSLTMPRYVKVSMQAILDGCIKDAEKAFPDAAVALSKRYMLEGGALMEADALQLKELFDIILTNAYEAIGDAEGAIEIGAERTGRDKARIWIKDTGVGMDAEEISRLSEPFYTTKPTGMGLGMSIVSKIVRLHDGAIDITSAKGAGTTVSVILPMGQKKRPRADSATAR